MSPTLQCEKEEMYTFSEKVKVIRSLIQIRIRKRKRSMTTKATSVFKDPQVAETLSTIHDTYVVVSADKPLNNNVLICKKALH
jgi:hypothetical protein